MKTCMNCDGPLPAAAEAEIRCEHCGIAYQPEELRALEEATSPTGGGSGRGGKLLLLAAVVVGVLGVRLSVWQRRDAAREQESERVPTPVDAPPPPAEHPREQAAAVETPAGIPAPGEAEAPPAADPLAVEREPAVARQPRVEATPEVGATPPAEDLGRPAQDLPPGRLPGLAVGPARIRWDSVGGPPQLVSIGGQEHVLGRLRSFGENELFAVAVDASATERWRVGPLTTYSAGYRHTHIVGAGQHVVVTLPDPAVAILALDSGEALRSWTLDAPVQSTWDAGDGRVGLRLAGGEPLVLDPAGGTLQTAAADAIPPRAHPHLQRRDVPPPQVEGLRVSRTLAGDEGAVASGTEAETRLPRVVGFDPAEPAARWTWTAPGEARPDSNKADDLRGTRYATVYGTADDRWHLTVLDVATGEVAWDAVLPDIFAVDKADAVVLGEAAVYVHRTSSVDVLRLSDGAYQGAIGHETYEGD